MDFIGHLWQPILLATFLTFIGSAVIWMALPHHKKEFDALPDEDAVMALLRKGNVQAGAYMFPYMSAESRADKEKAAACKKKWEEGTPGIVYLWPRGPMNMGKMMGQSFVFYLIVNTLIALLASHTMVTGAPYLHVFKIVGTMAFMTYFLGTVPECIWFGRPWKKQWLQVIDAAIYAGLVAGSFGWLWPR